MTKKLVKLRTGVSKGGKLESSSRLRKPLSSKKKLVSRKAKGPSVKKSVEVEPLEEELIGDKTASEEESIIDKTVLDDESIGDDETASEEKKLVKRKGTSSESVIESKKRKLEAKERKEARKSYKNNYELMVKAKKLWESVRRGDCPKPMQQKLCVQLHTLIKGRVKEIIHAHDTSRAVECLVVLGSKEIKDALFKEMKGEILTVMKSRYAKFFVTKMLKFGTKEQRNEIMTAMHGRIIELIRHRTAGSVVEFAYNEYATAKQRANFVEEFYGAKYAVFKSDNVNTLETILNDDPTQKEAILKSMKESLAPVLEKSVVNHSIIHRVIIEFLTHCNEKDRTEMIESVRDFVVEILHTKDGSRIGMQCIWHGTNKDRKMIIKSMKTFVEKICKDENGHMVLLAVFECVDDTKLIFKALIQEMMKSVVELALDSNGRKVLLHLVAHRNPVYIHPDVIKIFVKGDGNVTSKKDKTIRSKELLLAVSPYLLELVENNAEKLLNSSSAIILVRAILTLAIGDKSKAFEKIAEIAAKPFTSGSGETHIIENAAVHIFFKHLLKLDKQMFENGANDCIFFSEILLQKVTNSDLVEWIQCNRGTFTILLMLETGIPNVVERLCKAIKPVTGRLEKKSFKGAELLLDKLDKILG